MLRRKGKDFNSSSNLNLPLKKLSGHHESHLEVAYQYLKREARTSIVYMAEKKLEKF